VLFELLGDRVLGVVDPRLKPPQGVNVLLSSFGRRGIRFLCYNYMARGNQNLKSKRLLDPILGGNELFPLFRLSGGASLWAVHSIRWDR
jgi:hypothetical protein